MKRKNQEPRNAECPECLCRGFGPALSEVLLRLGAPEKAREHFDAARLEMLKGLRAILDARIERFTKREAKGRKIAVE